MREIKKGLKVLFLTLFAYLFQACAMQYLTFNSVTASLPFVTLAVFTVSLGKKYTFCASCIIGILTECMLSNVPVMYLVAYPIIAMLCAQAFADRSERQREKQLEKQMNRKGGKNRPLFFRQSQQDMPAHVRIPLCAMMMDLIWHAVMCVYMYLIGVDITVTHFARLFYGVLYTGALTVVLMVPMRLFLGMYRRKKIARQADEEPLPEDDPPTEEETDDSRETDHRENEEESLFQDTEDNEYVYDFDQEEGEWP